MKLRKYYGHVEFVPAPGHELCGEAMKDRAICVRTDDVSDKGQNSVAEVLQGSYQGPNVCFENSDWRFLEGPFVSISLVNVPWVGEGTMPAPEAKVFNLQQYYVGNCFLVYIYIIATLWTLKLTVILHSFALI